MNEDIPGWVEFLTDGNHGSEQRTIPMIVLTERARSPALPGPSYGVGGELHRMRRNFP